MLPFRALVACGFREKHLVFADKVVSLSNHTHDKSSFT